MNAEQQPGLGQTWQSGQLDSWRLLIPHGRRALGSWTRWMVNWGSRSRLRDAMNATRNVHKNLAGFSSSTEELFLTVGERLIDLQLTARKLANQTASIAELLSKADGSLAVLDEIVSAVRGSHQSSRIVVAANEIHENAKTIRQTIETAGQLVNTFDVLGVMTRIESSRFEAAGATFSGLADAVTALSSQIREQIRTTAESATVLFETTRQASEEVRRVARTQQENLGPLAHQASEGLLKIKDHRNRVSRGNTLLAERFAAVSNAVGDIVTALQFHDIVRQQIEHVMEALVLLDGPGSPDANIFETARLQSAQLDNSRTSFERSVDQIRNALGQIACNIEEVGGESARLLESSDSGEELFLASVESDLASMLTILDCNAVADRHLAKAAVSVRQQASKMSDTIAGVQAIGIDMQRIALNATIQAAGLGQDGEALEIVARAIQELAREAETVFATIESLLDSSRAAVSSLEQASAASLGADAQIAHLRRSAKALKSVQDEAQDGYNRTLEMIAGVKQQIRETITVFGAQSGCLDILANASEALRGLTFERPICSPAVERMTPVYTMQSEREVHEALYGTVPRNEDVQMEPTAPAPEENNVEFF